LFFLLLTHPFLSTLSLSRAFAILITAVVEDLDQTMQRINDVIEVLSHFQARREPGRARSDYTDQLSRGEIQLKSRVPFTPLFSTEYTK
jgi:hypothetical protein